MNIMRNNFIIKEKTYPTLWKGTYILLSIFVLFILFLYFLSRGMFLKEIVSFVLAMIMFITCCLSLMESYLRRKDHVRIDKFGIRIVDNGKTEIYSWEEISKVESHPENIVFITNYGSEYILRYATYQERNKIKNTISVIVGEKFIPYNGEDLSDIDVFVLGIK